jgi:hypothetical protein
MKRPTFSRNARFAVLALAFAALGGDCEHNLVSDPTFRDWCGDGLCAWKLDSGSIARAPTWNANDLGVAFDEPGTQISQDNTMDHPSCLLFTSVANLDPSAQMELVVDFNRDGTPDFTYPLPATQWHKVQAEITAPNSYSGITFHLRKQGAGTAVLAEMRIVSTTGCTAPASVAPLLMGEACANDGDCAGGLICTMENLCAQCDLTRPCPAGQACTQAGFGVYQCGAGQRQGAAGAPCLVADDCASGACEGASVTTLATLVDELDADVDAAECVGSCTFDPDAGSPCECAVNFAGTCR